MYHWVPLRTIASIKLAAFLKQLRKILPKSINIMRLKKVLNARNQLSRFLWITIRIETDKETKLRTFWNYEDRGKLAEKSRLWPPSLTSVLEQKKEKQEIGRNDTIDKNDRKFEVSRSIPLYAHRYWNRKGKNKRLVELTQLTQSTELFRCPKVFQFGAPFQLDSKTIFHSASTLKAELIGPKMLNS